MRTFQSPFVIWITTHFTWYSTGYVSRICPTRLPRITLFGERANGKRLRRPKSNLRPGTPLLKFGLSSVGPSEAGNQDFRVQPSIWRGDMRRSVRGGGMIRPPASTTHSSLGLPLTILRSRGELHSNLSPEGRKGRRRRLDDPDARMWTGADCFVFS